MHKFVGLQRSISINLRPATGMSIAKTMVEAATQPVLESIMDEHSPMQLARFSPEMLPRQIWELPVSPANALEESVIVAVCVPCP